MCSICDPKLVGFLLVVGCGVAIGGLILCFCIQLVHTMHATDILCCTPSQYSNIKNFESFLKLDYWPQYTEDNLVASRALIYTSHRFENQTDNCKFLMIAVSWLVGLVWQSSCACCLIWLVKGPCKASSFSTVFGQSFFLLSPRSTKMHLRTSSFRRQRVCMLLRASSLCRKDP